MCPLLAHSCSIFSAAEFHSPSGLLIKLPYHLSSSPGPEHDNMSRFEVFCELRDTLCVVTTLVLIVLFPFYNITVHGHETGPVLKTRQDKKRQCVHSCTQLVTYTGRT